MSHRRNSGIARGYEDLGSRSFSERLRTDRAQRFGRDDDDDEDWDDEDDDEEEEEEEEEEEDDEEQGERWVDWD